MINDTQKLIDWARDEKEKARKRYANSFLMSHYNDAIKHKRRFRAFSVVLQGLTLLLDSESENSGKNDADNSGKPM